MQYDLDNMHEQFGELTEDRVLALVSDYQIFAFYLGHDFKLRETLCSPLRRDNVPSWNIFEGRDGKLRYKDFATGESGTCITFVMRKFGCSYGEALAIINRDMGLKLLSSTEPYKTFKGYRTPKKVTETQSTATLGIKVQRFTKADQEYWAQYGLTPLALKYFRVYSVKHVFMNDKIIFSYRPDNPIYAYVFLKDGKVTYKIYRPKEPDRMHKWRSNVDKSVLQGWDQLPQTADTLILTKSMKDVMTLRKLGYYALACQTEHGMVKENVMQDLLSRFKTIYVLYDYDHVGIAGAEAMQEAYGVRVFFIQDEETKDNGLKDISDYRAALGEDAAKLLMKEKIEQWQS